MAAEFPNIAFFCRLRIIHS